MIYYTSLKKSIFGVTIFVVILPIANKIFINPHEKINNGIKYSAYAWRNCFGSESSIRRI